MVVPPYLCAFIYTCAQHMNNTLISSHNYLGTMNEMNYYTYNCFYFSFNVMG